MGNLLSKLTIGSFVGAGHFGHVHEGDDPVHGKVAVKQIGRKAGDDDAQWDARKAGAQEEAQNLKKAQHRNVVTVHHYVEDDTDELILYVMEFCEGGSLAKPYEAGPISIDEMRSIATDCLSGLCHLHANQMLHRDIKPGNLLRDARGRTKLGDFGLVTDRIVQGYGSPGDYAYSDHMAPEVLQGSPTSPKTDIWATGVTFYRLLNGKEWHDEHSPGMPAVFAGKFADKLRWLPHVPADWRRLIRSMLRPDPADRCQTVHAVEKGVAALSVYPVWDCAVNTGRVTWRRKKGTRTHHVVWERSDAKRSTWRAWSEPTNGVGNTRAMGGTAKPIAEKTAYGQLVKFFLEQT
ncbi:MAG: serine/threonine-protein kinase [Pseudomonadota bacterium]